MTEDVQPGSTFADGGGKPTIDQKAARAEKWDQRCNIASLALLIASTIWMGLVTLWLSGIVAAPPEFVQYLGMAIITLIAATIGITRYKTKTVFDGD